MQWWQNQECPPCQYNILTHEKQFLAKNLWTSYEQLMRNLLTFWPIVIFLSTSIEKNEKNFNF